VYTPQADHAKATYYATKAEIEAIKSGFNNLSVVNPKKKGV